MSPFSCCDVHLNRLCLKRQILVGPPNFVWFVTSFPQHCLLVWAISPFSWQKKKEKHFFTCFRCFYFYLFLVIKEILIEPTIIKTFWNLCLEKMLFEGFWALFNTSLFGLWLLPSNGIFFWNKKLIYFFNKNIISVWFFNYNR